MAFAIEASPAGRTVVLAVCGDVDIATASTLRERLADAVASFRGVVVDLEEVPFLDSTGLGVLVAAHNRARSAGSALVIARPQRIVKNALRLVQVDTLIDVYESLDDALTAVREG